MIKINFLTGKYHANPWGRHVREAAVEWGPSPYRIIRALIDTKFRKIPDMDIEVLREILTKLSSSLPVFHLPKASYSYIDIFKNVNKFGDPERKEETFDAFVVVNPSDPLYIKWDTPNLTDYEAKCLSELLNKINFLGRSESWVKMELSDPPSDIEWNSYPSTLSLDSENTEEIKIAVPVSKEEYETQRVIKELTWFDGLILRTTDLLKGKIANSPSMKFENYCVRRDRFEVVLKQPDRREHTEFNAILYEMESKLPPRITDSITIGDQIHKSLMSRYKKVTGNTHISSLISGRDQSGNSLKGHRHIFIMPLDLDYDGVLDHVLIESKEKFNFDEARTLGSFKALWQGNGETIRFIPVQFGMRNEIILPHRSNGESLTFLSETPVVLTRHYRKGRGDKEKWIKEELKHEALNHGLPEPLSVSIVEKLERKGHSFEWIEFRRNRKGDPDQLGYGFRLEFEKPVMGPISMGYGAHYGLGLFMPEDRK